MVDFGDRSLSHQTFLQVVWILLDLHVGRACMWGVIWMMMILDDGQFIISEFMF